MNGITSSGQSTTLTEAPPPLLRGQVLVLRRDTGEIKNARGLLPPGTNCLPLKLNSPQQLATKMFWAFKYAS